MKEPHKLRDSVAGIFFSMYAPAKPGTEMRANQEQLISDMLSTILKAVNDALPTPGGYQDEDMGGAAQVLAEVRQALKEMQE